MTTFVYRSGTFQFDVMPFGLMSTFQRMMDYIMKDKPFARVYPYDIILFSNTIGELVRYLLIIYEVIWKASINFKIMKCAFVRSIAKIFGHYIDKDDFYVYKEKISFIKEAPVPTNEIEMRSSLGLACYYRPFINGFAGISIALYAATYGYKKFNWTVGMKDALKLLKYKLTSPSVLAFLDFEAPFIVGKDISSITVGAVFFRKKEDGKIHSVQYANCTMNSTERNYSACERGALTVIFDLRSCACILFQRDPSNS